MRDSFAARLTVGVEEELMLLDPGTFALAPGVERLLGPEGLKTELFSCLVETNTPVCADVAEVRSELARLRGLVKTLAAGEGLTVAAAGTHPFSPPEAQAIVQEERYVRMVAEMGVKMKRQLVCGLHVHVGMASFEEALETLDAIVPWLPPLLALSLNSPYLDGAETGVLSTRAARLLELPRGGPPPPLRTREDWERAVAAAGVDDYTRIWWDARPHPRLGTIEVRILDQPTSLDRAVALVALVQALCAAAPATDRWHRDQYYARREAASRGDAATDDLLAAVEGAARELGTWELVETLREPPEAYRQLATGRSEGLAAAAAELAALS